MNPKLTLRKGCFIFLATVIVGKSLGIAAKSCSNKPNVKPKQSEVAAVAPTLIEEPVKLLLKAPSTALFTNDGQSVYVNVYDSTAVVTGYVDAQNSFGAMIRTGYRIKMKYLGDINDPGNWRVLESQLIE